MFNANVRAWQATAKGRKGLFDRSFDAEVFRNSTHTVPSYGPLIDSIAAHSSWITYLDEVWKVCHPFFAAVLFALHTQRSA